MNMISNNRCPDKYRNLTPKAECALRNARLQGAERPGGLPNGQGSATLKATTTKPTLRARIIAACPISRVDMLRMLGDGYRADQALNDMLNEGLITKAGGRGKVVYMVAT